jgi:hypothetical protein
MLVPTADAINAAARDLHARHKAANNAHYRLTLRYAYGNGNINDLEVARRACETIFDELLALRGATFLEWVRLNSAERKTLWGF